MRDKLADRWSAPVLCRKGRQPHGASARYSKILAAGAVALTAANCSSPQVASNGRTIDPKYGVAASPRVVADGEPVPKGGGREMVGQPYQVAGKTYVPRENIAGYSRIGLASWYGSAFHGRLTANGEVFDREAIAAAHTTMPLPSYARVTNLENKRSIIVRVNDRGPYHANRIMDVSERTAEALDFKRTGTARVRVDWVGRASTRGSDDRKLLATLRTDGAPAPFPGASRTMFAGLEPAPEPAPPPSRQQTFASLWSSDRGREEGSYGQERARAPEPPHREDVVDERPASIGRVVAGIPLPPERPFDLGTILNAATPVPVARAPLPPARPVVAGLFYASAGAPARFAKADPFKDLKPQRFVALKNTTEPAAQQR